VATFLGAHEIPPECRLGNPAAQTREDYLDRVVNRMLPQVAAEGLARYCDIFCESHVFSASESRKVLSRAKELGLGIRIHAEQLTRCGGGALAIELGATTADHLEWIDDATIEAFARAGITAVLLPGAVFNLGLSRYAPARRMIEAGVPVVLATDFNPGSSPTPSMQMVHAIACSQMGMTPAECVTASTINAAYSLGSGGRLGSIEPGKQADITIFNCPDFRQIPYFFGVNHLRAVIKRGKHIP
ncbi:MAG TPA: amidohydrolase family protein, partial [Blastocatellia bacterium]|nr:amidohydrolase family protein [Blastocatellia bacterium]